MRSLALLIVAATPLCGQAVRYEVSVPSPESRWFRVKAEFPAAGKDTLFLSLPAWSPGSYEIQNYARYVRHFTAQNPGGAALDWDRADKDTWRVATGRAPRVTVELEFRADTIDLSLARLTDDFGQFLGTNLFLFEEGQLGRPAEVRFTLPQGWRVTTALKGRGPYTATDYHELADAMTFVGRYALDSLQIDGRWIRLAVWPAVAYTPATASNLRTSIERMAPVQNRLLGGPPYDVYTVFFMIVDAGVPYGGGLEHSFSQFDILPQPAFADAGGNLGDFVIPLLSHEFFHLWNVKRIRPAEMWPYDYRAEQYTPLLWWSEGVTDYYADLTNLRGGLWTTEQFLENVMENMGTVAAAPEPWSVEDGSVATWIHEIYVNSSQLYYPEGSLIGLLLDVSMRDATDNAKSLDDVTRALFTRFYRQGKGFTTADLLRLLTEFGMPDVQGFYHRYIDGRDDLPYDSVLAKAGLLVRRDTTTEFLLGADLALGPEGQIVVERVQPQGSAGPAGVQPGDALLKLDDIELKPTNESFEAIRARFRGRGGTPMTFTVRRAGQTLTLTGTVQGRQRAELTVTRGPSPTPKQARIWQGLATGTTGP
ncbi:MAG TPA: PDZ domain-containing protein [Gemmatimonadales bacterium]